MLDRLFTLKFASFTVVLGERKLFVETESDEVEVEDDVDTCMNSVPIPLSPLLLFPMPFVADYSDWKQVPFRVTIV
ncbi:hypothetical protein BpHYR1_000549 [Brachionus plicatilis]|uniref:Uncharacterized protein n=1 Tax=Brachionus plicatilis TaxID=10195 RepID=A0A3M7RAH3_BRAPC|nr:hypothetical protein BpHYR1_000549 [Brachionus plicatilis]